MAIGDDYRIDTSREEAGASLILGGEQRHFEVFIEAMGQRPLGAAAFPFPSLRQQGIVRDAAPGVGKSEARGIAIDDAIRRVLLQLDGTCKTCPSSRETLDSRIRDAIERAAPEVTGIEVQSDVHEVCELCGVVVPSAHRHVVDLSSRAVR